MAPVPRSLRPLALSAAVVAAALLAERHVSTQVRPRTRHTHIGGYEAVEGEVLVKYRTGRDATAMARAAAVDDLAEAEPLNAQGIRRLRSRRFDTAALLARLNADPDVEFAEPNYVRYVSALPNDPSLPSLWGLLNTGLNPVGGGGLAGADIDASTAWNTTTGSRAHVVGVVDTGVDYTHPDLAANMWSAPAAFQVTIGGVTITCQAGTHGFNAIARTCNPMDDHHHGTHVAGTIGAVGNNGLGVAGVNWVASMMALKFQGPGGTGYTSDAIAAIEFAIQAKAAFAGSGGANVRVLSNSWGGGGYSQALANAVAAANAADMLFVAAAGNSASNNDQSPVYPAALTVPNVVTVASSTSADTLSSFSNYGATSVHLAAAGGGQAPYEYQWAVFNGATWTTVTPWQSTPTFAWTPTLAGTAYQVAVRARGSWNAGPREMATTAAYTVMPRVTSLTLTPGAASPQAVGTSVSWTAAAAGGQAPYLYQWAVFDGAAWTTLTPWQSSPAFTWTPAVAGSAYQVAVRAKGSWNPGAREMATTAAYTIMPKVTALALSADVAAPQPAGATITWTAGASGGQAPYEYQWAVYDGATWQTVTPWQSGTTFTWTPATPNAAYQVAVRARGTWNTGPREMATVRPFAIQ